MVRKVAKRRDLTIREILGQALEVPGMDFAVVLGVGESDVDVEAVLLKVVEAVAQGAQRLALHQTEFQLRPPSLFRPSGPDSSPSDAT